ncbi:MAG: AtpZ/AtpI family protein [Pseudomonadota bacterium]
MSPSDDRDKPARGEISAADREAFKRRTAELDGKLRKARLDDASATSKKRAADNGSANGREMGRALRLSTELVGGIVVGVGLGILFDKLFGTWPLLFILFFLLGAAAGMLNLIRSAMTIKTGPSDPSKGPAVPDDEDDDR